jgi:hypothetical protein
MSRARVKSHRAPGDDSETLRDSHLATSRNKIAKREIHKTFKIFFQALAFRLVASSAVIG